MLASCLTGEQQQFLREDILRILEEARVVLEALKAERSAVLAGGLGCSCTSSSKDVMPG